VEPSSPPRQPPRRPLAPSWLAAQGRLPLAFMAVGLSWLVIATALLAFNPAVLAMAHVVPGMVAMTHAWILGFFVTIAVGAIYQLAPVALGTTLWSERAGWWHLALHTVALPVMVYSFWHWDLSLLGPAGSMMLTGILVFGVNVWATIARSGQRDAVAWSLALASGWLILTGTVGLLLIANRAFSLWAVDPVALLRAHAHLGLVGFFLTLLQGVTFRLVPMFTLGEVPDWRPVRAGLWLSQLGLLLLAPALAFHHPRIALAAGCAIAAGIVASGWGLRLTLAMRKKRLLDPGLRLLLVGVVILGISSAVGLWLVSPSTAAGSKPGGLSATVYGLLIIFGGLLPAISGMMGKIVPFLTWMRAYGPKVGRAPTPPATSLSSPRLERAGLTLQAVAVVPLVAGAWLLNVSLLRVGTGVLAIGSSLFLANMIGVLRHLWRSTPAPTPKAPEP
jgi:hypothetical protein